MKASTIVNDQIIYRNYLSNDQKVLDQTEKSTHNHLNMTNINSLRNFVTPPLSRGGFYRELLRSQYVT